MAQKNVPRGRFAPSPTGKLHLGNARSALLGYLWAKSLGGEFLVRVEDLDAGRCRRELVETLFEDLDYLGIRPDEAPLYQSERGPRYAEALQTLEARGLIYPCVCSRQEIQRAASAPHGAQDDGPRYPGTCAQGLPPGTQDRPRALRFRAQPGLTSLCDELHGDYSQDVAATVGDFVVRRADGVASYQLAVVVDDYESAITHVLRGDDLLSSTPRQLQLYQALGFPPPAFAHVGLLVGPDGKRMAKREGAFAVADLRKAGIPAERLLGLLAAWSGLSDGRPTSTQALVPDFALSKVPRGPVTVTEAEVVQQLGL
jgi:glutamyl-tRNA synthetase